MTDKDKNINIIDSIRRIRDRVFRNLIRAEWDLSTTGARISVKKSYERDDFSFSNIKYKQQIEFHMNRVKEKKDLLCKWNEILTYTIEMFV